MPILFLAAFFALVTQRWMGMQDGIQLLQAKDAESYLAIARAAPDFPVPGSIPFLHGQRFVPHWILGGFSKWSGISLDFTYFSAVALACLLIVALFWHALSLLKTPSPIRTLLVSTLILNPWSFRYYWLVPTLVADLLFVACLCLVLIGLFRGRFAMVLVGTLSAGLFKQSILFALPAIAFGLLFLKVWERWSLSRRIQHAAAVTGLSVILYWMTGRFVMSFAERQGIDSEELFSLVPWLMSPDWSLNLLAEHLLRSFMPLFIPIAIVAASLPVKKTGRTGLTLFLFVASLMSGALLPSPIVQQQSQSRYTALALIPALLLVGWCWSERNTFRPGRFTGPILGCALGTASLHHLYAAIGPATAAGLVFLQLGAAAATGFALISSKR